MDASSERQPMLAISGLSKAYGSTVALEHVSIEIGTGEVHALLGENGAGKSTFVKSLTGVVRPDSGVMTLAGAVYAPRSILEARSRGVVAAFQELSLVPNLSVAQNFFLPRSLKHWGLNSRLRMEEKAAEILRRWGGDIPVRQTIERLTLAQRQQIELIRALERRPDLLILDEPTAALTDPGWLFEAIAERASAGGAILYISHRLAEIRQVAQRATVLRNGRSSGALRLAEASDQDIFLAMVGRSSARSGRPTPSARRSDACRLVVNDLRARNVDGVSFELREGEVLGVAALEGQGQRELFRALAGEEKQTAGQIVVEDRLQSFSCPRDALKAPGGIAFVPEERKTEGIFASLPVASNITLPRLSKLSVAGVISPTRERKAARDAAAKLDLGQRYLPFRIGALSGGNQQKAIIARALMTGAKTLLLFDPSRGIDVGTKETIYAAIRSFADRGGSVLVYSSEIPELISLVDRCLVLYRSRVVASLANAEMEEDTMMALLTGNPASASGEIGAQS
ncbi:sugar ABC transporter ATP-binding protein [Hansschlegelia plantiphila]|uniref:ABC transporter n=1 Tax=Hansschlegelia plantiphila TaxID=374655 RepID=A0A9W6MV59_9HYPH|nr:sugar ABC transporter ATP-binding protein [Hansschlegelia plantiphila]GLK67617.1 ABC transporter [Hansschlegelia plantiphila]